MERANFKKWVKLAVIVAVFAALLLLPQPAQYHTVYGQGYGYGSTGSAPSTASSGVSDIVTSGGVFTKAATIKSDDNKLVLDIPKGTTGKTEDGKPLAELSITKKRSYPALPADTGMVGFPYDLEPDGATFDPAITLKFTYDPNQFPSGVGAKSLTLGYYDEDSKKWVKLEAKDITVDPDTNTITAKISHFTYFGVMANSAPAEFTVSGLTVPAAAIGIAEAGTISVMVANTGDVAGTTTVTLKLNGVAVSSRSVKLAGHESRAVSFTTIQGKSGSYNVDVDGLTGTFTVKAAPVTPIVIKSTVPSISVPSVTPAPTAPAAPAAPTPTPEATPWLAIILSLVLTAIAGGIIVWYYGFRRTY